jgi:hypothetical protein
VLPLDTPPLMVQRGRKHSNDSRCVGTTSTYSVSLSRFDVAWETCVRTAQRVSVVCKPGATFVLLFSVRPALQSRRLSVHGMLRQSADGTSKCAPSKDTGPDDPRPGQTIRRVVRSALLPSPDFGTLDDKRGNRGRSFRPSDARHF